MHYDRGYLTSGAAQAKSTVSSRSFELSSGKFRRSLEHNSNLEEIVPFSFLHPKPHVGRLAVHAHVPWHQASVALLVLYVSCAIFVARSSKDIGEPVLDVVLRDLHHVALALCG